MVLHVFIHLLGLVFLCESLAGWLLMEVEADGGGFGCKTWTAARAASLAISLEPAVMDSWINSRIVLPLREAGIVGIVDRMVAGKCRRGILQILILGSLFSWYCSCTVGWKRGSETRSSQSGQQSGFISSRRNLFFLHRFLSCWTNTRSMMRGRRLHSSCELEAFDHESAALSLNSEITDKKTATYAGRRKAE